MKNLLYHYTRWLEQGLDRICYILMAHLPYISLDVCTRTRSIFFFCWKNNVQSILREHVKSIAFRRCFKLHTLLTAWYTMMRWAGVELIDELADMSNWYINEPVLHTLQLLSLFSSTAEKYDLPIIGSTSCCLRWDKMSSKKNGREKVQRVADMSGG